MIYFDGGRPVDEFLTLRQERDFDIGSPFLIFKSGFSETNIFLFEDIRDKTASATTTGSVIDCDADSVRTRRAIVVCNSELKG